MIRRVVTSLVDALLWIIVFLAKHAGTGMFIVFMLSLMCLLSNSVHVPVSTRALSVTCFLTFTCLLVRILLLDNVSLIVNVPCSRFVIYVGDVVYLPFIVAGRLVRKGKKIRLVLNLEAVLHGRRDVSFLRCLRDVLSRPEVEVYITDRGLKDVIMLIYPEVYRFMYIIYDGLVMDCLAGRCVTRYRELLQELVRDAVCVKEDGKVMDIEDFLNVVSLLL